MKMAEFFDKFRRKEEKEVPRAKLRLIQWQLPGPYVNIKYAVEWAMPDGSVRVPEEGERRSFGLREFSAGGREYLSLNQLMAEELVESQIYKDVYGRSVFAFKERFPCFDSYDYLHENRYYRWFYVREGDTLSCVYYRDECDHVHVVDDLRYIDKKAAWEEMNESGWQG